MGYIIIGIIFILFIIYALRLLSFRSKSINYAMEALKYTIQTLPAESTPSIRVMEYKLAQTYYELSKRSDGNDIRSYVARELSVINPKTGHVAMALLINLSIVLDLEHKCTKLQAIDDIAKWCRMAVEHLAELERNGNL